MKERAIGLALDEGLLADALSVQSYPPAMQGGFRILGQTYRTPPLPSPGTREREWQLRQYSHNPYNTLYRSAASGIVNRLISTPWEISVQQDRWQSVFMRHWERNIARLVKDYLRHDSGAWIEIIAPGDPRFAPTGPAVGINVLDSLRVYPTGNPVYPAIYYDIYGKMHMLHCSRIVQFVDNEESEENLVGYGECALVRCIAAVRREILINKFIETYLDDKPTPGLMLVTNIGKGEVEGAFRKMEQDQNRDDGGEWGRTLQLYSLDEEHEAKVSFVTNSKAPEGFDLQTYKGLIAKEVAAGMGLDIQDFWELSGGGIGTGAQSEIKAQKARGKTFGRILKGLERVFNQVLPEGAEFRWKNKDPQADLEDAQNASTWAATVVALANTLTKDEQRQVLADKIEAYTNVLIDEQGNLKRYPDSDPLAPGQSLNPSATAQLGDTTPVTNALAAYSAKAFSQTAREFIRYFDSFVRVGQAQNFTPSMMRPVFREELFNAGVKSYEDGLRDGGAEPSADPASVQARRQIVAEWLAVQNTYIDNLIGDVNANGIDRSTASDRARLWVNKSLQTIYYAGLYDAAPLQAYRFELGSTIEHCDDCLALNGQVHTMKDYLRSGLYPKSSLLACKGFECGCKLVKSKDALTQTVLPHQGLLLGLVDRLAGFLGRQSTKAHHAPAELPDLFERYLIARAGVS